MYEQKLNKEKTKVIKKINTTERNMIVVDQEVPSGLHKKDFNVDKKLYNKIEVGDKIIIETNIIRPEEHESKNKG